MRTIFVSILFSLMSFAAQANVTMSCSNGDIMDVGDGLFRVEISNAGVTLLPYEGSMEFDASQVVYQGDTIAIMNQTIMAWAEGDQFPVTVDAMLSLGANGQLNVSVSYDKKGFHSEVLDCTTTAEI